MKINKRKTLILFILFLSTIILISSSVLGAFSLIDTLTFGGKLNTQKSLAPNITINFAGNKIDLSGPYYLPPGEESLDRAPTGYYTNASSQLEDFIYINCTVEEATNVQLHWLNETTWTNGSYVFINPSGNFWEFNSSGNITTHTGYNYSFDIWANDSSNNINLTWWNKTGAGGTLVRRIVQLNNTASNFNYTPYYFWNASYIAALKADRLHHDQSTTDASDRGYLLSNIPGSFVNYRHCALFVTLLYDETICINPSEINNIYYHFWWSSDNNVLSNVGWGKEQILHMASATNDSYSTSVANNRSSIYWNNGQPTFSDNYFLDTRLTQVNSKDYNFTDNEINQFYVEMATSGVGGNQDPTIISNRSFTSFVLLNVPNNATLQGQDTDSDNLNDFVELYISYTNPFLQDTDNDGINDYWENLSGSDPNNWTQAYNVSYFILYDTLTFGGKAEVQDATIDTDISPDSWDGGTPSVNTWIMQNFTYYQNGTATIDINITFNDTNYTFVSYATWVASGYNQWCANFTIDLWVTETNVAPGYPPTTVLNATVAPTSNFTFGIRIWMPKTITYGTLEESFTIVTIGAII